MPSPSSPGLLLAAGTTGTGFPTTITFGLIGVALSLIAWGYFLRAVWRITRFIRTGEPLPGRTTHPWRRAATLVREVFGHTTMFHRPVVAIAHWLVMVGFLIGVAYWFEAYIQVFSPASGWPWIHSWPLYALLEELIALGTIAGILVLITVRARFGATKRLSRFFGSNMFAARLIEAIVFAEGLGMILVKAGQIATFREPIWWADFLSARLATWLPASPVLVSGFALFKLLVGMVFLVLVARHLDWGVAWHRFLAFFNIYLQRNPDGSPALGGLAPMRSAGRALTLETVSDEDHLGVGTHKDASWKLLLDAATCTECGRCQDLCPAWNTEKPLSPKRFMIDLRHALIPEADLSPSQEHAGVDVLKLAGETISDEVLWSCTNCGACVDQCPVDIEHIDHIADLRRFRVLADSEFPSELTSMFKALETKGNPWGRNQSERASWVEEARRDGIEVPIFGEDIQDFTDTEYLFWVGCAGAFDDAGRATTRAVVELLHIAGVKFAVLAKGETCTGDPARRAGNEFLFQMLAAENIDTLDQVFHGVPERQRKIITTCPHCFNTLRNEYPDFGGSYDVFHHTQLLNRLVRDKRLTPVPRTAENRRPITYHDPCFLGRHNQVFDPPRELLDVTGMELREMDHNRNEAFCCGAGGARMFQEEKLGTRINEFRTQQALATGAETIAVGCPFCNTMLTGGVKAIAADSRPEVRDVARMLRDATLIDGHLPAPRPKEFLELPIRALRPAPKREAPTKQPAPPTPAPIPHAGSVPVPGAPAPAVPAVPVPGAVLPVVPAPPAVPVVPVPGAAAPPAVPIPGAATPPAVPAVPVPGAAKPPTIPAPPAVPVPGAALPPAAPAAPAIPVPGAATPPAPPAPPVIPIPGAAIPPATPPIPAPGTVPPIPPVPPAPPGAAIPPVPKN